MSFSNELSKRLGLESAPVIRKRPVPPGSIPGTAVENPQQKPRNPQATGGSQSISRVAGPVVPKPVVPVNEEIDEIDALLADIDKPEASTELDPQESTELPPEINDEELPGSDLEPEPPLPDDTPESDVDAQMMNEPSTATDEQSESLTASAEVVKKIDSLVDNWSNLAEDLGLTHPDFKLMEMDYSVDPNTGEKKPGKISVLDFFMELGKLLEFVKDGVVTINTMSSQQKTPEMAAESAPAVEPELEPEPSTISEPGSASEIQGIADQIPTSPSF